MNLTVYGRAIPFNDDDKEQVRQRNGRYSR
jgi:hypothetical protein